MLPRAIPLLAACAVALSLIAGPGCINTRRGDTLYRVKAATPSEEKQIRRQLWRIGRAMEDVRVRYALDDVTVHVVVTDLQGLGETTPAFSGSAEVSGSRVLINKRLLLDEYENLDEILHGLAAHELMHALHYARMPRTELIVLGQRYAEATRYPHGRQRPWVRAYERLTDMMTIRMGYGEELIHQKRASEALLTAPGPPEVWDFYLTEPEIRAMMADPDLLLREARAALVLLELPSATRLFEKPIELDEDGDLVRLRTR